MTMCEGIYITDALTYAATRLSEHGHDELDGINVAQLMRDAAARIDLLHEMLGKAQAEAEHKIAVLEGELRARTPAPSKPVVTIEHVQVGDLKAGDVIKSGSERWKLRETPRRVGNGRVALQVDMNRQRPSLRATRKLFRQETVFLVERIQHT